MNECKLLNNIMSSSECIRELQKVGLVIFMYHMFIVIQQVNGWKSLLSLPHIVGQFWISLV